MGQSGASNPEHPGGSVNSLLSQFCCPDLTQAPSTSKVSPGKSPTSLKNAIPPAQRQTDKGADGESTDKLVMLVDDFYYGTYEGNRTNAAQDNLKEPLTFKCLSCGKKLRSNIRYVNLCFCQFVTRANIRFKRLCPIQLLGLRSSIV